MIRHLLGLAVLTLTVMKVSVAAAAVTAFANTDVNLRAGPGTGYPVVRIVTAGTRIANFGCLADYSWCDVGYAGLRGWVAARYITVVDRGAEVVVTPPVAVRLGVPVVVYGPAYWNAHYRAYPWYARGPAYYRRPLAAPCRFGCTVNRTVTGPRGGTWSGSVVVDR